LHNDEIGRLFGMSYSAISHILSAMRTRLKREPDLMAKYNRTIHYARHLTGPFSVTQHTL